MTITISTTVNGNTVSGEAEPNTLLVHFLRDHLGLTGTHVGCDTTQCGACTIHVDGRPVKSCTMLAIQAEGHEVTTIEGIGEPGDLHPMQAAFQENHGLQCGFCTPGMIMAGIGIVERNKGGLTEEVIRDELEGNICRCTGYQNIVQSIAAAAKDM